MDREPRDLTPREQATRAAELEKAANEVGHGGEKLAEAAQHLEAAADIFWAWDRDGRWPPLHEVWHGTGELLRKLRVIFPSAGTHTALRQLLDAGSKWKHPAQVLDRPRPDYRELANLARARHERARGNRREQLADVLEKLERAAKVEETARKRREEMRGEGEGEGHGPAGE